MKKLTLFFVIFLMSTLSFAQDYQDFVGKWTGTGENGGEKGIFLIIKQEGNSIKLEFPDNPAWRAEFHNIRIEDGVLKFEQINYSKDNSFKEKYGKDHPYSGVVNYCEMWKDKNGKMLFRIWTDYMKGEPPIEVTKLNESLSE